MCSVSNVLLSPSKRPIPLNTSGFINERITVKRQPYCVSLIIKPLINMKIPSLFYLTCLRRLTPIDHQVLLNRLHQRFGFRDLALKWLASYLVDRKQSVHKRSVVSVDSQLRFGVPQGSVLDLSYFPCMLLRLSILSFHTASILCSN